MLSTLQTFLMGGSFLKPQEEEMPSLDPYLAKGSKGTYCSKHQSLQRGFIHFSVLLIQFFTCCLPYESFPEANTY